MADAAAMFSPFELRILEEINRLRSEPRDFIPAIRERRKYMERDGTYRPPDRVPLVTKDGDAALIDAIDNLSRAKPVGPLRLSIGMTRAARDHCADLGPKGVLSHEGSDKSTPFVRMSRYGRWRKTAAENLAFGEDKPEAIILQMIIDDGVKERGHRKNLLNGEFTAIGCAIGKHSMFENMFVLDFAGEFEEGAGSESVAAVPLDTAPPAAGRFAARPAAPAVAALAAAPTRSVPSVLSAPAGVRTVSAPAAAPPPTAARAIATPPTALLSSALARLGVQDHEIVSPPEPPARRTSSLPATRPSEPDHEAHESLLANLAKLKSKNFDDDEWVENAAVPAEGERMRPVPPDPAPPGPRPPPPPGVGAPPQAPSPPVLPPPPPPAPRVDPATGEPLCAGCGGALGHTVIKALDASWHKYCFVCYGCKASLAGGSVSQFYSQDGAPFCKTCYEDKFSPKCKGCGKAITGTYATALGASWHPECMACSRCRGPIHGQSFYKDARGGFLCLKCGNDDD